MRHYTSDAFFVTSDNHLLCKVKKESVFALFSCFVIKKLIIDYDHLFWDAVRGSQFHRSKVY